MQKKKNSGKSDLLGIVLLGSCKVCISQFYVQLSQLAIAALIGYVDFFEPV